ncbi:hypothetical protein [Hamadaea tsunoensis]|uniref:hypothetical protein n=1 Tax=Hamadaea tsunoensis TaxID=53368 RepID=UPI000427744A|nr:hypothetical protein [Hamadaea tsunoensis]
MRRFLTVSATLAVVGLAAACGPATVTPDDADHTRLAQLRTEGVLSGASAVTEHPGSTVKGKIGAVPDVVEATLPAAADGGKALLAALRSGGWTVTGAECAAGKTVLGGFRQDGALPRTVRVEVTPAGTTVTLMAPFHTDHTPYFGGVAPQSLTSTCVETGESGRAGTFPSLGGQ